MTETTALVKPNDDAEVMAFYEEAVKLQEYAEKREILTTKDLEPATNDLGIIAIVKKGMKEKREDYVKPLQERVKEYIEAFKMLMAPIEEAERITKTKMLAFDAEQKRIRQEQEEINRLKIEAAEKEMKLHGELSEAVDLVEVSPPSPTATRTDMGLSGQTDHWKYEVVDFAILPDEYKLPDTAMLNAIAKKHHDKKQVPGVRFYNDPYINMRAKRPVV